MVEDAIWTEAELAALSDEQRFTRDIHLFLRDRHNADAYAKSKLIHRDRLKEYITEHGYEDGSGNLCLDFEQPMTIMGKTWRGLQLRRVQGAATLDEDWAFNYIEQNGLEDRAINVVVTEVIDQNELAVLNQEGLISDDDLDQMFVRPEITWALYPVEA